MDELGSSQGTRSGNQTELFASRRAKKSPGWKLSCHVLRTLQGQHRNPSQGTPMPKAPPFPSPCCLTQGEQRSSGCSCSTASTGSCPVWQAGAGHRPAQVQTVPTLWSPTQSPSPNKLPIKMLITGLCGLRKWVSREVSGPGSAGYPGAAIFPIGVPGSAIMQGSELFLGLPRVR